LVLRIGPEDESNTWQWDAPTHSRYCSNDLSQIRYILCINIEIMIYRVGSNESFRTFHKNRPVAFSKG
jgi:hypothetical protein